MTLILVIEKSRGRGKKTKPICYKIGQDRFNPEHHFIRNSDGKAIGKNATISIVCNHLGREAFHQRLIEFDGSFSSFLKKTDSEKSQLGREAKLRWLRFISALPEKSEHTQTTIINMMLSKEFANTNLAING